MSLAKGVLGALLGGVVGGAVWTGVAYATGWEFSILAIVVGGAAGFGMGMGNNGRGGAPAGVLAALVAIVCILGAKLGVAHLMAQKWIESNAMTVTEDDARTALMERVYMEFDTQGHEMTEPDEEEGFPPEVWTEADRRWHAMSLEEREDFRAGLEAEMLEGVDEATGMLTLLAFVFSFGIFDLLCLGLAVSTAYKTASTGATPDEPTVVEEVAQPPAMFRMAAEAAKSAGAIPEPAPSTAAAAPSRTPRLTPGKLEEAPTGLGIFSRLGKEPQAPTRVAQVPARPSPAPAPAPTPAAQPTQQIGLIDLDLDDDRKAA